MWWFTMTFILICEALSVLSQTIDVRRVICWCSCRLVATKFQFSKSGRSLSLRKTVPGQFQLYLTLNVDKLGVSLKFKLFDFFFFSSYFRRWDISKYTTSCLFVIVWSGSVLFPSRLLSSALLLISFSGFLQRRRVSGADRREQAHLAVGSVECWVSSHRQPSAHTWRQHTHTVDTVSSDRLTSKENYSFRVVSTMYDDVQRCPSKDIKSADIKFIYSYSAPRKRKHSLARYIGHWGRRAIICMCSEQNVKKCFLLFWIWSHWMWLWIKMQMSWHCTWSLCLHEGDFPWWASSLCTGSLNLS